MVNLDEYNTKQLDTFSERATRHARTVGQSLFGAGTPGNVEAARTLGYIARDMVDLHDAQERNDQAMVEFYTEQIARQYDSLPEYARWRPVRKELVAGDYCHEQHELLLTLGQHLADLRKAVLAGDTERAVFHAAVSGSRLEELERYNTNYAEWLQYKRDH